MSPVTHFLSGWVLANCAKLDRKDRALVTLACVIPDIDGLGIIPEILTRNSAHPLLWFTLYHHSLHNLAFALIVSAVAFVVATRKWATGLLALLSFTCICSRTCLDLAVRTVISGPFPTCSRSPPRCNLPGVESGA
jgi:inner membrane protein